ncbi:serine/threonine-protein phosphatase Stp1 [Pseudomonas nitritireducens]|uniref:Serine/threonine-protein phosphatase Stp1 n=1 Tax=Pseudomonas nitroreducens TaxID=46680 RepID=A0A7W7KQY5_PSENT|nr:PP2C family serine/threonine-protein phosphatase [Pseudomonas nitritireducens]MBB4866934.1 serine/threonine-protein phosphatase Stp1 [Pseudomonas nitritireducens]
MQVALRWSSTARTDTGKVRARNEDAFLDHPEHGLWVVADGMGGHSRGDRASRMIVEALAQITHYADLDTRTQQIRQQLHWLNRRFVMEMTQTADQPPQVMGSTVVALLLDDKRATCIWAGDSRCYLWRDHRLYQLTRDHSLQQQLMDEQGMDAEQARRHPSAHALTCAVGVGDKFSLDTLELNIHPGDTFLLCSDGLYNSHSEQTLGNALSQGSIQGALDQLIDLALEGSARDNLTAVVIRR